MELVGKEKNIMTFNGKELIAIIKMAKAMVEADGKIEPSEVTMMAVELARFGVPKNQLKILLEASDNMEVSQALVLINEMDEERKKYVASYLGVIMVSDGDVNEQELVLWNLVTTLCSLPEMNITEAINNMKNL
ncbi:TerB family tellurite resistance protein [Prevotella sp. oral taxon 299]|uniref:TerB family tellurite resistance protein n=1 Tax=Prevotella sp. oral taxon 299 TaxID=652716 RepID=UPI0001C3F57D|nr:TerB family tellurite resistance protein [Prevotella sp. oral taxon 299]